MKPVGLKKNMSRGGLLPVSLFSYLADHHQSLIKAKCREISAAAGSVVLEQAEESFDLYFVLEGEVKVSLLNEDGREVILDILRTGAFFGELSFLDHRERSAMVTAVTDAKMLFLPRETFEELIGENPDIAISLLSVMAGRLRKTNETIETLTFLDVSGRVAKVLLDTAKGNGIALPGGAIKMKCPTHQTIADRVGASREAVTKAIRSLIDRGLITTSGKEIIISPKQFEL